MQNPSVPMNDELFQLPLDKIATEVEPPRFCSIAPAELEAELKCSICCDFLRNPQTSQDCPHSFCEECITKYLRGTNKECPNCRVKMVSRRSLRADPSLNAIVLALIPDRNILDKTSNYFINRQERRQNNANSVADSPPALTNGAPKENGTTEQEPMKLIQIPKPPREEVFVVLRQHPTQALQADRFKEKYLVFPRYGPTLSVAADGLFIVECANSPEGSSSINHIRNIVKSKMMQLYSSMVKFFIDKSGCGRVDDFQAVPGSTTLNSLVTYVNTKILYVYLIIPSSEQMQQLL